MICLHHEPFHCKRQNHVTKMSSTYELLPLGYIPNLNRRVINALKAKALFRPRINKEMKKRTIKSNFSHCILCEKIIMKLHIEDYQLVIVVDNVSISFLSKRKREAVIMTIILRNTKGSRN